MSSQATVQSVDALKAFRGALALYGEDTLAALGAVESEVRRTVLWLEQNRPAYWHEQIKRRREEVSRAKAEVFRRKLQKRPDYTPAMSEQVENLRRAEASLQDAEKRLTLVRKWQPRFQHALLEYHGTVQRLKDLAATDIPNAALLLGRIVESIEAYLAVHPPSSTGPGGEPGSGRASPEMEAIASRAIAEEIERLEAAEQARAEERARAADAPVTVPVETASEATEETDPSPPA